MTSWNTWACGGGSAHKEHSLLFYPP